MKLVRAISVSICLLLAFTLPALAAEPTIPGIKCMAPQQAVKAAMKAICKNAVDQLSSHTSYSGNSEITYSGCKCSVGKIVPIGSNNGQSVAASTFFPQGITLAGPGTSNPVSFNLPSDITLNSPQTCTVNFQVSLKTSCTEWTDTTTNGSVVSSSRKLEASLIPTIHLSGIRGK